MGVYKIFSKMIEYGLAMCSIYVSMVCVDSTLLLSQLVSSLLGVFVMFYQVLVMTARGKVRVSNETSLSAVKSVTDNVNCDIEVINSSGDVLYKRRKNVHSNVTHKLVGIGADKAALDRAIRKRGYLKLS